jgi:hypothetical protein
VLSGRHGHSHSSPPGGAATDLRDGDVLITRPWRCVNDEKVQLAPFDIGEELLDQAILARTAPEAGRKNRNKFSSREIASSENSSSFHTDHMMASFLSVSMNATDMTARFSEA